MRNKKLSALLGTWTRRWVIVLIAASALVGAAFLLADRLPVSAQGDPRAQAPSGLTAALDDGGQVVLSWNAPAENAATVTDYQVLRRILDEQNRVRPLAYTGGTAATYVDGTVEAGKRYIYRVKALRGEARSRWSNQARIDVPADEDDATPTPTPTPTPEPSESPAEDLIFPLVWQSELTVGTLGSAHGWNKLGNFAGAELLPSTATFSHLDDDHEIVSITDEENGELLLLFHQDLSGDAAGRALLELTVGEGVGARTFSLSAAAAETHDTTPLYPDGVVSLTWSDADLGWDDGDTVPLQLERVNRPAGGAPTISGAVRAEETLTADTSGITDPDGLVDAAFTYRWLSDDGTGETEIAGATGATYTPTQDDVDRTLRVRVDFTDDAGFAESRTSEPTDAVLAAGVPDQVSASADQSSVTVTWAEPPGPLANGYQLQRRQTGLDDTDQFTDLDGDDDSGDTSYVDDTVLPLTTYAYRVRTVFDGHRSDWSQEEEVLTERFLVSERQRAGAPAGG